jgi:hypothetical protein
VSQTAALQAALAAEQATVYGYGVAAAILQGTDRAYATSALAGHTAIRDQLTALITAAHSTPVAALPAYQLPFPVSTASTARELAAHLEQGCAGAFWDLIAASPPQSRPRSLAIGWLTQTSLRAAHWGAGQALPGQPA